MDISSSVGQVLFRVLGTALLVVVAGCGGSGYSSGGGGGGPTPAYVTGVAATGAPVAGSTVTLKDAAGHSATATTAADGSFTLTVTGLTAPFLVTVPAGGSALYSFAGQAGDKANLNPYTTVVLAGYYAALGGTVANTFNGTPTPASFPSASQLNLLKAPIVNALQPFLSNASVATPGQFDPFTTSFAANHTGFDQVLDRTVLNGNLLGFTVDNGSGTTAGAVTSTATLSVTAGSNSAPAQVTVGVTTSNGTSTSSSSQSVPVGTSSAQQSDLAAAQTGVLTLFNALHQLAVNKPGAVTAADVAPYVDSAFLDHGDNASVIEGKITQFLNSLPAGATFMPSIYRVNAFSDGTPQLLYATVRIDVTSNNKTETNYLTEGDDLNVGMVFKRETNGGWTFYGHQTIAKAHVDVQEQRFYDANGNNTTASNSLQMQAQVSVASGALTAASVSGPANSLPDCTKNPSPLTQSSVNLVKDAGTFNGGDRFDLPCAFTNGGALAGTPPPAGTAYSFSLTKADTTVVQQPSELNAATTDNGDLLTINGTARAQFTGTVGTVTGTQVTLTWTPPQTYSLAYSFISAFCQNATEVTSGGGRDLNGDADNIPPGTNTGTITIPSQCDGAAPAGLTINVWFVGVNGERSLVSQHIHN